MSTLTLLHCLNKRRGVYEQNTTRPIVFCQWQTSRLYTARTVDSGRWWWFCRQWKVIKLAVFLFLLCWTRQQLIQVNVPGTMIAQHQRSIVIRSARRHKHLVNVALWSR